MIKKKNVVKNKFVIGVDGGGTKTAVVLADMEGKIVTRAVAKASNPRDIGIGEAVKNIGAGIYEILKRRKNVNIASVFIGLPAMEEEYKNKKQLIIREIKKNKKIASIFKGKIKIGSDQLVAFRAGSYGKDGIVAICGTGTAVHGWNNNKEALSNNYGWVSKGSSRWIGEKVMQAIAESLDGRGQQTKLAEMVFKKYKFNDIGKLLEFFYVTSKSDLPKLAVLCDEAAMRGDKVAQEILIQSGKEVALSVRAVAVKLGFFEKTPLVLVGGTYKSRWVADTAMDEIQRYYPGRFDFVVVGDPIIGAVRLAIESVNIK